MKKTATLRVFENIIKNQFYRTMDKFFNFFTFRKFWSEKKITDLTQYNKST